MRFQTIRDAILQNANAVLSVAAYRVRPQPIVESFKLPTIRIAPAVIPRRIREASPDSVQSHGYSEDLPPPTRVLAAPPPVVALPTPSLVVHVPAPVPAPVPAVIPAPVVQHVEPASAQALRTKGYAVDPICIGLERADAMYAIATPNVRQSLECEEARRLEARIGELYKEESGRSRGWTKTRLEAFLVPRAATGGRVPSKIAFDWSQVWTDKDASAILDFVCLAKGIRIAVWKDEVTAGIWPAADKGGDIPLYHVSSAGILQNRRMDAKVLLAPYSVEHALEKLTLDELDNLAEKLGIPPPSGKKADKVRAVASARMRLRFN